MFERINNYIQDNSFHFTVYNDKIHIVNYKRIISLEDNYISLQTENKRINIIGNHFILKKLLKEEMVVNGMISQIEVLND